MWLKAARLVAAVAPSDTWINQIVACAKTMLHDRVWFLFSAAKAYPQADAAICG